ncbi:MAG: ATP-binding protein [Gemmatimonadales bacterium]
MSAPEVVPPPSPGLRPAIRIGLLLLGVVVVLLVLVSETFDTLSAARAYVGGESLWSKAQKDAVYHLVRYAYGQDPVEYVAFQEDLQVSLGDRDARVELLSPDPDMERVRQGFLRGRNHPDDLVGMASLLRRFHGVFFLRTAIKEWEAADSLMADLAAVGVELHWDVRAGRLTEARRMAALTTIDSLTHRLTQRETGFSEAMGAGARWATPVLFAALVIAALLLLGFAAANLRTGLHRFKASEALRRASDEELHELVREARFGIIRSSFEGRVLAANPALVRMLGYANEAELQSVNLGKDVYVDAGQRRHLMEQIRRWRDASLGEQESPGTVEVSWRRKDGAVIQVRMHGRLVPAQPGSEGTVEAFVEDVTHQRAVEAQLRQSQKMEAVGQLTGGIAHDFNNLLTVILSMASLVEQELPPEATGARGDIADLKQAALRGADMVRTLLAFSRAQQLQFHPMAVGPLIEASARVLRRVLPESIELRVTIDPAATVIRTDPAAIEQILLNLATNARDAMAGVGLLEIRTSPVQCDGAHVGAGTVLEVRDNGAGMDGATRERLFEPFFTTKPLGEGTGLGMTMVYSLVQQHGGTIAIESTPGRGTRVCITFPAADLPPETVPVPPPDPKRGRGTVLIVEDEEALRRAAQRLLERHGYEVLLAVDGEDALTVMEADADRISVILSDVVMPNRSGTSLYAELRRRGVRTPFVFMSGYVGHGVSGAASLPEGVPFLPKPWEINELLVVLEQTIQAAASPSPGVTP